MGALVKARNYTPAGSDVPIPTLETWPKLFNLKLDKNESYNVVERNEATAEKLRARFIELREEFYGIPRGWK